MSIAALVVLTAIAAHAQEPATITLDAKLAPVDGLCCELRQVVHAEPGWTIAIYLEGRKFAPEVQVWDPAGALASGEFIRASSGAAVLDVVAQQAGDHVVVVSRADSKAGRVTGHISTVAPAPGEEPALALPEPEPEQEPSLRDNADYQSTMDILASLAGPPDADSWALLGQVINAAAGGFESIRQQDSARPSVLLPGASSCEIISTSGKPLYRCLFLDTADRSAAVAKHEELYGEIASSFLVGWDVGSGESAAGLPLMVATSTQREAAVEVMLWAGEPADGGYRVALDVELAD